MKKSVATVVLGAICLLSSCLSTEVNESAGIVSSATKSASGKKESQVKKAERILLEDNEKLTKGETGTISVENIESVFQPKEIKSINEITEKDLAEPGQPYYFKLTALYKGYDNTVNKVLLQDLSQKKSSVLDAALGTVFGIDTDVYSLNAFKAAISELPIEANSTATFYLVAFRITDDENGNKINESAVLVRFVRNIEKPYFNPKNFIVSNSMHYITIEDAHVPTQQDVMAAYFFGGRNASGSVFDPTAYPLVDLMDARAAMDKKDIRNNYTFPSVKAKYVSEVLFMGQTNTTITVCTDDKILTERMKFTGRVTNVKQGERIKVYFTICKNPLEEWEIQAVEKL